jgi:uncharacterized RDD family membrane protein YckC
MGDSLFCGYCEQLLGATPGVLAAGFLSRVVASLFEGLLFVLTLGIGYIVWMLFVSFSRGQTPGKQLLGLAVYRTDGSVATWGMMFLREIIAKPILGYALSAVGIGFLDWLWILIDRDRQAIHDKLVGTVVVRV